MDNDDSSTPMVIDSQDTPITQSIEESIANVSEANFSNTSPSSAPTAIAHSPPPRRSVQRLTSVLPRGSPNSAVVDSSENRPALKFKPKSFIRRSKEEREAVERAESERQAARLAAERGDDRGGPRGRGRVGRGGASDMNRWKNERFNLSHEASGHLGGATVQDRATRGRGRGRYGSIGSRGGDGEGGVGRTPTGHVNNDGRLEIEERSESTSTNAGKRVKKEPAVKPEKDRDGDVVMASSTSRSKPRKARIKKEDQAPTYVSSEGEFDSEGGKKVDIERINLVTSSEDSDDESTLQSEVSKGKQRQRTPHVSNISLRPVRIQRQEHVERAVGVNTDASSLTSAELRRRAKERAEAGGTLFMSEDEVEIIATPKVKNRRKPKDVEFVRDERRWKGVYQDEDDKERIVKIKDEPKDENDTMQVDPKEPEIDGSDGLVHTEMPIPNRDLDTMDLDEESGVPLHTAIQESLPEAKETLRIIRNLDKPGEELEDELTQQLRILHPKLGRYTRRGHLTGEQRDKLLEELDELWTAEDDEVIQISISKPTPTTKVVHNDDDEKVRSVHESTFQDGAEARSAYIFQLPPIIPSLRDSSKKPVVFKAEEKNKAQVQKEEKKKAKAEGPNVAGSKNPFNVNEEIEAKPDCDALANDNPITNAYIAGGLSYPGGHVGVLEIHARGQMRAYWGGMGLEISKSGGGENINQELMITNYASEMVKKESEDDNRWEEKVDIGQKGWTMGQTQPGYKCVPEWGSLLT